MMKSSNYKVGPDLDRMLHDEFYPSTTVTNDIPSYSSDDIEAFKLLKDFRDRSEFCCIEVSSDYHYLWYVKLYPGFPISNIKIDEHKALLYLHSESFAEVVCIAIMEASVYAKNIKFSQKLEEITNDNQDEEV